MLNPSNVPFISPPATKNGGPVPYVDWTWFSYYGQADEWLALCIAALTKMGAQQISLSIIEGAANGDAQGIALTVPVSAPFQAQMIGCFEIVGTFVLNGVTYQVQEWAGLLVSRQAGNYIGVDRTAGGVGGPNLYFVVLGPYPGSPIGTAEAYFNP